MGAGPLADSKPSAKKKPAGVNQRAVFLDPDFSSDRWRATRYF
jgi:hypothetical protein